MESMSVRRPVPDVLTILIPLLEQKARIAGLDSEQYLRSIVSRDLMGPKPG